jgi:magnesium-transporting ATPase (P-type)
MTKKRIRSFTNAQKDNWKKRKKIINGTFAPSEERQHLPTSSSSTLTTITPTTQQSSPHTTSSVPLSLPSSLMEEEMIHFLFFSLSQSKFTFSLMLLFHVILSYLLEYSFFLIFMLFIPLQFAFLFLFIVIFIFKKHKINIENLKAWKKERNYQIKEI